MDGQNQDFTQTPDAQFQSAQGQSQGAPQQGTPGHQGNRDNRDGQKQRENQFQGLIDAYEAELVCVDEATCPNVAMLVRNELFRLRGGVIDTVDVLSAKKTKVRTKVDIPVETYPNVNFVGKLLGPAGKTLKMVQEQTNTKMSILGAGSLRNADKEAELLATGDPKYNHLRDRLHLQIDSIGNPSEAYYNISYALSEVKKAMSPDVAEQMMAGGQMGAQMGQVTPLMGSNGGFSSGGPMRNSMSSGGGQRGGQRGRGGNMGGRGSGRGGRGGSAGTPSSMGHYAPMNGGGQGFEGFSDDYPSMGFEGYTSPPMGRGGMGGRGMSRNTPYSRPM